MRLSQFLINLFTKMTEIQTVFVPDFLVRLCLDNPKINEYYAIYRVGTESELITCNRKLICCLCDIKKEFWDNEYLLPFALIFCIENYIYKKIDTCITIENRFFIHEKYNGVLVNCADCVFTIVFSKLYYGNK